jgi:TonB family protein
MGLLGLLLVLSPATQAKAQGIWKAQPRELAKAPGKQSERATQTWDLAATKVQPEAVIKDLQSRLSTDPERDVRLAAAWALGHLRVRETTEPARAYDSPPRIDRKSQKVPSYPPDAWAKRIQGTVVVECLIDEQGQVAYAEVRASIPALDDAALAQAKQWRFTPAAFAGRPVAAMVRAPVGFRAGM